MPASAAKTPQSAWLRARPQVLTWVYRGSGAVLVGLGLSLAFERRD